MQEQGGAGPFVGGVQATPLTEQVHDTLRGWILDGGLGPGERLRVRDLAERVGTSVMPVREAIRRLVETGLVVHEPYRGAHVRGLDVTEMHNVYDVRILLEAEAARLGTGAVDDSTVELMKRLWGQMEQATDEGDFVAALEADERMLGHLYDCAGNEALSGLIRQLWNRCRPYRLLWARATVRTADGPRMWGYKPALVAAAEARDGVAAERVIRESYGVAQGVLGGMLRAQTAWVERRDM